MLTITFSNDLESLYYSFRNNLLTSKTIFEPKEIVVPGAASKTWLKAKLASDVGIAAGLNFHFFNDCYEIFFKSKEQYFKKIPSKFDLQFAIICFFLKKIKEDKEKTWQELADYLRIKNSKAILPKEEKNLILFSREMANLFNNYCKYETNVESFFYSLKEDTWQKQLFFHLFGKEGLFLTLSQKIDQQESLSFSQKGQIHLFTPAFLSKNELKFFAKISNHTPTFLYLFSLSRNYYGDMLSQNEALILTKQLQKQGTKDKLVQDLNTLLFQNNPLLANFGKAGRLFFNALDGINVPSDVIDHYSLSESIASISAYQELIDDELYLKSGKATLLKALQADLTLSRTLDEKIEINEENPSLRIHRALSKAREVEALYNDLSALFNANAKTLSPEDVLVVASDITSYEPHFIRIFGAPESPFPYRVAEVQFPSKNPLIQAFLNLLNLGESRFELKELFQLLEAAPLKNKFKLDDEEIQLIKSWLKATLSWGLNAQHQKEKLQEETGVAAHFYNGENSLQEAIQMLLKIRAQGASANRDGNLKEFSSSSLDLLERLLYLLKSLEDDLTSLKKGQESAEKWQIIFTNILKRYFEIESEEEDAAHLLRSFGDIKRMIKDDNLKLSFAGIKSILETFLENGKISHRDNFQNVITLSSLKSARAVPYKVIAFLGLQDELFPKQWQPTSLDKLKKSPLHTAYPEECDIDRLMFLELILAAQHNLILTYSTSDKEKENAESSPIIKELLDYLDSAFTINQEKPSRTLFYSHDEKPYDRSYFNSKTLTPGFRKINYLKAIALSQSGKRSTSLINLNEIENCHEAKKTHLEISLNDLYFFLKNPLKTHLKKKWGLSPLKEAQDELIALPTYKVNELTVSSLSIKYDPLDSLKKELPKGLFQKAAYKEIQREKEILEQFFQSQGLLLDKLIQVDLLPGVQTFEQKEEELWVAPALKFNFENGDSLQISGRLKNVSPFGLIRHLSLEPKNLIPHLPDLLIYFHLIENHNAPFKKALIALSDKPQLKDFSEVENSLEKLKQLSSLYLKGINEPLAFLPEWIEPIACKDRAKLDKALEDSFLDSEWNYQLPFLKSTLGPLSGLNKERLTKSLEKPSLLLKEILDPFAKGSS